MAVNTLKIGFPCCKDCMDRYPACSASCQRYQEQRKAYDALKAKAAKNREYERLGNALDFRRGVLTGYVTRRQR